MERIGLLRIAGRVGVAATDLEWIAEGSGGPGGQHRQRTASRIRLRCPVTALVGLSPGAASRLRELAGSRLDGEDRLVVVCDEERVQSRNREIAWVRLRALVAAALPEPKVRRATKPSRGSVERRLGAKRRGSEIKDRRRGPSDD